MKATIEIPDELYRRVKAKSALQGRAIREVTMDLYQHWLAEEPAPAERQSPEAWLEEWTRLDEATLRNAPPGPTATEILAADRNGPTLGPRVRPQEPEDDAAAKVQAEQWLNQWHMLGQRIETESVDPRSCVDILLADRR